MTPATIPPASVRPRTSRTAAALLTEAELLGASVAPERRAEADRLLEGLRFDLAREGAHDRSLSDDGLPLVELRKLADA